MTTEAQTTSGAFANEVTTFQIPVAPNAYGYNGLMLQEGDNSGTEGNQISRYYMAC